MILLSVVMVCLLAGCNQTKDPFLVEHFHYDRDVYSKIDFATNDNTLQYEIDKENVKLQFNSKRLIMENGTLYIPGEYEEGRIILASQQKGKVGIREYRFLYLINHKVEMAIADFEFYSKYNEDDVLKKLENKKIDDITNIFEVWNYNPNVGIE